MTGNKRKNHTANYGDFFLHLSIQQGAKTVKELTESEKKRYQRQILIPSIGESGQEKIAAARVLVAGAGGLGSPVLYYLAAAGIGTIGIADPDNVEISNLQRQILYCTDDIGRQKASSAAEKITALNPGIKALALPFRLDNNNIDRILAEFDLVVDCSDNFRTRYVLSDASIRAAKPMVYGAVFQFFGQVSVFNYKNGPSYRDLYPGEAETEDLSAGTIPGIIGALPGIVGSFEVCETLKIITGIGDVLSGKLLQIDALNLHLEVMSF